MRPARWVLLFLPWCPCALDLHVRTPLRSVECPTGSAEERSEHQEQDGGAEARCWVKFHRINIDFGDLRAEFSGEVR